MLNIRPAEFNDVCGISMIVNEVWGQTINTGTYLEQIRSDDCAIWMAVDDGVVAGFVSAFLTVGLRGYRRWEVDLLAVGSAWRGHQLGQKLVEATWADAHKHQVDTARAIIRIDNIGSQRSFERAGYTTDYRVYSLFLWPPEAGEESSIPQEIVFLPVDTLTYRGLWIEGLAEVSVAKKQSVVATACAVIAGQNRENTGALVPTDEVDRLASEFYSTATTHGEYHQWIKPLEKSVHA